MKNSTLALSALAVALALAGCGKEAPKPSAGQAPGAAAAATEVKIGHVGPLTGGIAHLGKDNENGARLAIEEANAAGVKIGDKAVKFTLVAEDEQADPKVGTTVAQKQVDSRVVGVVGHLKSGT
jgi:branched-chain amino acid transport system substrate-binding protein